MKFVGFLPRLDLKKLILSLALISVFTTLGNSYYSTYYVQHALLINSHLHASHVYASKMANTTNAYFDSTLQSLSYSAHILRDEMHNPDTLQQETHRLLNQLNAFNIVVIINNKTEIIKSSPANLNIEGMIIPMNSREDIESREPRISDPLYTPLGQPFISISYPIFSSDNRYLGAVSGIVFLRLESELYKLLGQHSHQDNSSFYVIDRNDTVIYHVDAKKIGKKVPRNLAFNESIAAGSGSERFKNKEGIDVITGYAHVDSAGWAVVESRPTADIVAPLNKQVFAVFLKGLPLTLVTLLLIWLSAIHIAKPLRLLSKHTMTGQEEYTKSHNLIISIKTWYFEAQQLKQAILNGMESAHAQIHELDMDRNTDPLTGLYNRRGMQNALNLYDKTKQKFSIIALDIDHFKCVNDTFGHSVGDQVIQRVSDLMRDGRRTSDVLCRVGGEEFLIFLPDANIESTQSIADELRQKIEQHSFPIAGNITISLGVSLAKWQDNTLFADTSIEEADQALYTAKKKGRNTVVVFAG